MQKIVLVLFDGPDDRAARRALLIDELALRLPCDRLQICVADEHSDVRGPSPFSPGELDPIALVSAWTDEPDAVLAPLREAGFTAHAWEVESDVYTDYGEHPAHGPRDWPDGTRSPTVSSVNFLERPPSIELDEWIARWRGRMSPVSAELQPRVRYVRNLLTRALTDDAPAWQAIVEEVWPTPRHVANPFLFYGASNPFTLAVHMSRVLAAVLSFIRPWRVRAVMMSEYFLRTEGDAPAERRP